MDRQVRYLDDWQDVGGAGTQQINYPFLNGLTEVAKQTIIDYIASEQWEKLESAMMFATPENQERFKQWKHSQTDAKYPFLTDLDEDTRNTVLEDLKNERLDFVDSVMKLTDNWSVYDNWKKEEEEKRFCKLYPFLIGSKQNIRDEIVRLLEEKKLDHVERLIRCHLKKNLGAFEAWKLRDQVALTESQPTLPNNTPSAPPATSDDPYPFLHGESDPVRKTMMGHIENGRWQKADEFSAVLSNDNLAIYQQWKLKKEQEVEDPYPFLRGAPQQTRSAIESAINAKDMNKADALSLALFPDMLAIYSDWRKTQPMENLQKVVLEEPAKEDNALPFLVNEATAVKTLITAKLTNGQLEESFVKILKPDNQKRYAEWKSKQQQSTRQAAHSANGHKTLKHIEYTFLIGADQDTADEILEAINANDLEAARHLGELLSGPKRDEFQNWLNERALGLNFLDGEPENLRAAMIRKMENRELEGMAVLSKKLSQKNLKLFRNWHDNEKSGLSFLNGIPDQKVMSNLRGYCANRQFTGAEALLDVIPAANKKGYLAWKESLPENAPVKATYGIGDDDSHTHTSNSMPTQPTQPTAVKPSKTVKATSPVPEAGDPSNFFQKNLPDDANILILGETGIGKSTFINSFVNYVEHSNMEDAEKSGPTVLIPASFSMNFGDNYDASTRIVCDPTVSGDINRMKKNENVEPGQSSTQGAKEYTFTFTKGNQKKTLHIIDTPGIGDSRGLEQDKINFDNILTFIANYKEIHAICILLKPNAAKLNVVFKFCIDQLLMRLHKTATESIVFCFTSAKGTQYKPGDTFGTLQTHLKNLQKKNGTQIELNTNTMYSFDNEGFRYLCARKQGHQIPENEKLEYKKSYDHSVREVKRLVANIGLRKSHRVLDTICVNSTRHLLLTLMKPIGEISQQQMFDLQTIAEKKAEIEQLAKTEVDLTDKLNIDTVELMAVELPHPRTVCTSAGCIEYENVEGSRQQQTIYKTICHSHCGLVGVAVETCPNEDLRNCSAMGAGCICRVCKCSYNTHMHIRYQLVRMSKQIVDPNVQRCLDNNDSRENKAKAFIEGLERRRKEIGAELDYMRHCCVEFASFLKRSSIISYNDSYGEYVKYLIKAEDQKVQNGGDRTLLDQLIDHQQQYKKEVAMLENDANNQGGEIKNLEDLHSMVKKLHQLKHCGAQLAQLHHFEKTTAERSTQNTSTTIKLNAP